MTIVNGRREGTNSGFRDRGIRDQIIYTNENLSDAGFLTFLNRLPTQKIQTPTHKFGVKNFVHSSDTLAANATAATNYITVSNPDRWIKDDVFFNTATNEYCLVISKNGSNLEVYRGLTAANNQGGIAATAMVSGQTIIRLMPTVNPQRSTKGQSRTRDLEEIEVFTQAFRYDLDIGLEDLKHKYDIEQYMESKEYEHFLLNAKKDMGRTFLLGEQGYINDGNAKKRLMKGAFRVPTTYSFDADGVLYGQALNRFLQTKAFKNGSNEKVLFAGDGLLASIHDTVDDKMIYNHEEVFESGNLSFDIDVYKVPGGKRLKLVEDRALSESFPNDGVIVDMNEMSLLEFIPMEMRQNTEEPDATNKEAYIYGQLGLMIGDEAVTAKIINADVGAKGSGTA